MNSYLDKVLSSFRKKFRVNFNSLLGNEYKKS